MSPSNPSPAQQPRADRQRTGRNILIVSEKPSRSLAIAPIARAHWPADSIAFVHAVPYGNIKFTYPRGLRMQDYPVVSNPKNSIATWAEWACAPLTLAADGMLTPTVMSDALFSAADLIVCACDPDHTGAIAFDVLMRVVFGDDRGLECPALRLCALDEASVKKAFADMQPFWKACGPSLEYGLVKRYFDWNWNVNSLAVLGVALRRAGAPADAPPLSKYSLQVLYAIRKLIDEKNAPPLDDGKLVMLMERWPGTGRYAYSENQAPVVGSCASRGQIIENLVAAGLLARSSKGLQRQLGEHGRPPTRLQLADRGRALLELLHPDCEDPDLPFRLDAWCQQGSAAKPAVDRYIRTFFGKQMRFKR